MKSTPPTKEKGVSERELEQRTISKARAFGWKCWHFHDSRRQVKPGVFVGDKDAAGVFDWIIMHHDPPRLVFLEFKRDGNKLSEAQREFGQAAKTVADRSVDGEVGFGDATIGVVAVWPKDEDAVERMLRTRIVA